MSNYTSDLKRFCSVFKSSKKKEMYIYTDRKKDLSELPDALMTVFGEPVHVLDMLLTPEKRLARVDAMKVLSAISEQGFFLQMPPADELDRAGEASSPKDALHG
jgi:uncharacterized protein YcgL (UPF0745 family)